MTKNRLLVKSNQSAVLADKVQDMTDRYDYTLLQTRSVQKEMENLGVDPITRPHTKWALYHLS